MPRLTDEDPSVFAKCPKCDRHGMGVKPNRYFGRAYSARQFRRTPTCDNCGTSMVELFRLPLTEN